MPLEAELLDVAREREKLTHAVTIVVVLHVLAPVHEGQRALARAALLVVVVVVDHLLAPVRFDDGRDDGNDIVANALDERRLLHDETIREFHEHLGAAALGRVHAAGDPVQRLGLLHDHRRLRVGRFARVCECVEIALVLVQVLDGLLVGDHQDRHVAAFLGLADGPVFRPPRRRLGDGREVFVHVVGLVENSPRADDVAEMLERRRNRVRCGQVVDEFGGDARVTQELLDELGVLLVVLLLRARGRGG